MTSTSRKLSFFWLSPWIRKEKNRYERKYTVNKVIQASMIYGRLWRASRNLHKAQWLFRKLLRFSPPRHMSLIWWPIFTPTSLTGPLQPNSFIFYYSYLFFLAGNYPKKKQPSKLRWRRRFSIQMLFRYICTKVLENFYLDIPFLVIMRKLTDLQHPLISSCTEWILPLIFQLNCIKTKPVNASDAIKKSQGTLLTPQKYFRPQKYLFGMKYRKLVS